MIQALGVSLDPLSYGVTRDEWLGNIEEAFEGERGRNFIGRKEPFVDEARMAAWSAKIGDMRIIQLSKALVACAALFFTLAAFARQPLLSAPSTRLGLTMGFMLYAAGFVDIGGEWFAIWQSQIWNGQEKAFEFLTMISAILLILLIPELAGTG
jgi:hypothetical protein